MPSSATYFLNVLTKDWKIYFLKLSEYINTRENGGGIRSLTALAEVSRTTRRENEQIVLQRQIGFLVLDFNPQEAKGNRFR